MHKELRLTSLANSDRLPHPRRERNELCMKGGVYTKEKCPICGERFQRLENDLLCPAHQTRPKRYYVQLYASELHKHINIFTDRQGYPFTSYEQAARILNKIRSEIDEKTFDPTRYVTEKLKPLRFSNWSESWLQKKETEVKKGFKTPSYLKAVRVYVRKFQKYFGEKDIRDIGTKAINDFYLTLDASPKYLKNILDGFQKMLQDAFDWGDIKQMPKFPKVDVPETDIETIDLDLQDSIINSIPDPMDRTFILFLARLMLRPCEPRALYWEDLDFKHHRVKIRRHYSLNEIRPATKSKNIKVLPLDGELEQALLALPRHLTSQFVFWKRNGHPFSESWARKLWKRACKQMEVEIGLYQGTKHSSATELADREGVDLTQEFLGHSNRAMTKRYVRQNPERLRKGLREK
jgi:integrase